MARVRKDEFGIFVNNNGARYRPVGTTYRIESLSGVSHCNDMNDGGLKEGDSVKVVNIKYAPLCKVVLESGQVLLWSNL